ncbi:MAG: hypothetical protein U1E23_16230 [Reyranellaceae bacterium]
MSAEAPNGGGGGGGGGLVSGLVRVAAAFGAVAAANAGRRLAVTIIGYLGVVGLLVASLCFMTAAGHGALVGAVGEILASVIVGSVYLVAALALALALQLRGR